MGGHGILCFPSTSVLLLLMAPLQLLRPWAGLVPQLMPKVLDGSGWLWGHLREAGAIVRALRSLRAPAVRHPRALLRALLSTGLRRETLSASTKIRKRRETRSGLRRFEEMLAR